MATTEAKVLMTCKDASGNKMLLYPATKAEQVDGLGTAAVKNTGDFAAASHNHDSRYYTESEMGTKLNGKANSSHTHNYAGSGSAGGTANSVNGFTFGVQTSDPGAGSSLTTNKFLFVYE